VLLSPFPAPAARCMAEGSAGEGGSWIGGAYWRRDIGLLACINMHMQGAQLPQAVPHHHHMGWFLQGAADRYVCSSPKWCGVVWFGVVWCVAPAVAAAEMRLDAQDVCFKSGAQLLQHCSFCDPGVCFIVHRRGVHIQALSQGAEAVEEGGGVHVCMAEVLSCRT
jgi:hypothetical protein